MSIPKLSFYILAVWIPFGTARSQPSSDQPIIQVQWRAMSVGQTLRGLFFLDAQANAQNVFIPNGALSRNYTYRGTDPMIWYRKDPATPDAPPTPVASISFQDIQDEAILFVSPDREGNSLRVESIPMENEALPNGHTRLINLTPYPIAGFHNGTQFQLGPRASTILPFDTSGTGVIKVSIQIAALQEDTWHAKLNSSFGVTPDMSVNLLITPAGNNKVEMIPLRERKADNAQLPAANRDS